MHSSDVLSLGGYEEAVTDSESMRGGQFMDTKIPDWPFEVVSWYQALTIAERADALRRLSAVPAASLVNTAHSPSRFERWRAQAPFGDESLFQRRLAVDGLTEPLFRQITGEPIHHVVLGVPAKPPWLGSLEAAFMSPLLDEPLPLPPKVAAVPTSGFLELGRPLIDEARRRLCHAATELAGSGSNPPFDPSTVDALLAPTMAEPMLRMLMRTMVLELNVAKLQGQLSGETPKDRFDDFIGRLRRPDVAISLLLEYPVLARHLVRHVDQWVENAREFLAHLVIDGPAIRALFSPGVDPGPVICFEGHAGDTHRKGRAVAIVTFRSGLKLVYKPKPLAVEIHFQELLGWLNDRGADPPFRILRVLDRGDHGWSEFVEHRPCASLEEVDRFYARQGENLALLYAIGASDFHFENLIASGEHPVLVDLEALFHPMFLNEPPDSLPIKESLFRTSLLPQRVSAGGDYAGIDDSGLSSPEGQLTPYKVLTWDNSFQDTMRFVRRRAPLSGGDNQPMLPGSTVEITNHLDALLRGFDTMYALLSRERDAMVAAGGPIERFVHDEMRVVMRNTRWYLFLLGEAFHPDALRDALDQERILDRVWTSTARYPHLLELVELERAALARYDVPLFTIRPGSMDIVSDSGARISGLVAVSGQERTIRRLRGLDARDHVRQRWCIDAAFASLTAGDPTHTALGERDAKGGAPLGAEVLGDPSVRCRLLNAATAVGDRLATLAFVDGEITGWNILHQIDERYWTTASAGLDLYSGVPGIALFLAQLGRLTGSDRHTQLMGSCIATIRMMISTMRKTWKAIGGFDGWGGVLYALANLAWTLDDRSLLSDAESIVEILPSLIVQDDALDVIAGAAGCIGGLLALYRAAPSPRTLAVAISCGERLLARGQAMAHGMGWRTPIAPEVPLCGFSHGAAGIGWALLELAAVTNDTRFHAAAEEAFRYERSYFSPAEGTWTDLRTPRAAGADRAAMTPPHLTTAWCHGSPGIGLVRLRALARSEDPVLREEVTRAVAATIRGGFGHNHSLCHGDLGNLELLLHASADPADAAARAALDRCQTELLESIGRNGFRCATPGSIDTPGLMIGLAGIGHGLLRLADPVRVPSVLMMEGPDRTPRNAPHAQPVMRG